MHSAAKWTMIVGFVLAVLGGAGIGISAMTAPQGTPFIVEEKAEFLGTEGELLLEPYTGYTVFFEGECNDLELSITADGQEWDWWDACDASYDQGEWTHVAELMGPDEEAVMVQISANGNLAVVNDEAFFSGEMLVGVLGGLACCLAIPLIILAGILAMVLDDAPPATVAYGHPQGQMVAAQAMAPVQGGGAMPAQAWGMGAPAATPGAVVQPSVVAVPQGTTVVAAPAQPDHLGLLPAAPVGQVETAPSTTMAPAPVPLSESRPAEQALSDQGTFWTDDAEPAARPGDEFMS